MTKLRAPWTGPDEGDVDGESKTLRDLPDDRWPYGPPDFHEACCLLQRRGIGVYCDCKASDASDVEWGEGASGCCSRDALSA